MITTWYRTYIVSKDPAYDFHLCHSIIKEEKKYNLNKFTLEKTTPN